MKVYISGPITMAKDYEARFSKAEEHLAGLGYGTINPVDFGKYLEEKYKEEGKTPKWENYMRGDIELLLSCDGIYMLKGWEESKGAKLEYEIATALKMKVLYEEDLK